jgi:hypothetical protein
MKVTKTQLRRLIREELSRFLLKEGGDNLPAKASKDLSSKALYYYEKLKEEDPGASGRLELHFDVVDAPSTSTEGIISSKMTNVEIDPSTQKDVKSVGEAFVKRPYKWRSKQVGPAPVPQGSYTIQIILT